MRTNAETQKRNIEKQNDGRGGSIRRPIAAGLALR
jgi:hypothetical protein